jgi:hypothetical protein
LGRGWPLSAFLTRTATPSSVMVAPSVRVPVRTAIFRLFSKLVRVLLISSSSKGRMRGSISTSVTFAP